MALQPGLEKRTGHTLVAVHVQNPTAGCGRQILYPRRPDYEGLPSRLVLQVHKVGGEPMARPWTGLTNPNGGGSLRVLQSPTME